MWTIFSLKPIKHVLQYYYDTVTQILVNASNLLIHRKAFQVVMDTKWCRDLPTKHFNKIVSADQNKCTNLFCSFYLYTCLPFGWVILVRHWYWFLYRLPILIKLICICKKIVPKLIGWGLMLWVFLALSLPNSKSPSFLAAMSFLPFWGGKIVPKWWVYFCDFVNKYKSLF